jgi:hypothetical protein
MLLEGVVTLAARLTAVPLCLPPMQSLVTGHAQSAPPPQYPRMSEVYICSIVMVQPCICVSAQSQMGRVVAIFRVVLLLFLTPGSLRAGGPVLETTPSPHLSPRQPKASIDPRTTITVVTQPAEAVCIPNSARPGPWQFRKGINIIP